MLDKKLIDRAKEQLEIEGELTQETLDKLQVWLFRVWDSIFLVEEKKVVWMPLHVKREFLFNEKPANESKNKKKNKSKKNTE